MQCECGKLLLFAIFIHTELYKTQTCAYMFKDLIYIH
jgi:hypothetical protein